MKSRRNIAVVLTPAPLKSYSRESRMAIFTPQPFTSPLISFSARPISPPLSLNQSISSSSIPSSLLNSSTNPTFSKSLKLTPLRASTQQQIYTYPDPIPEFAEAETQKFSCELLKKLYKNKDPFGNDLDEVVKVCAEIFREFLHKEYGGPGTLLVEPFTDMLVAIKEKELPGAPVAARAALLWAQNYLDKDWDTWTSQPPQ